MTNLGLKFYDCRIFPAPGLCNVWLCHLWPAFYGTCSELHSGVLWFLWRLASDWVRCCQSAGHSGMRATDFLVLNTNHTQSHTIGWNPLLGMMLFITHPFTKELKVSYELKFVVLLFSEFRLLKLVVFMSLITVILMYFNTVPPSVINGDVKKSSLPFVRVCTCSL